LARRQRGNREKKESVAAGRKKNKKENRIKWATREQAKILTLPMQSTSTGGCANKTQPFPPGKIAGQEKKKKKNPAGSVLRKKTREQDRLENHGWTNFFLAKGGGVVHEPKQLQKVNYQRKGDEKTDLRASPREKNGILHSESTSKGERQNPPVPELVEKKKPPPTKMKRANQKRRGKP